MDNKMIGFGIIGIIVAIALLSAFAPIVADLISGAADVRQCTDAAHPYECLDNDDGLLNWCSNETDGTAHCISPLAIYNVSTGRCTNASGVSVVNTSQTSVCDSTGWAAGIVAYENVGVSPVESSLMSLIMLFVVLAILFAVAYPLLKKNN